MTPELAKRLAVVFPTAPLQETCATSVAGVAVASRQAPSSAGVADPTRHARKPAEIRRQRPLRLESGKVGELTYEAAAGHLTAPDVDVADAIQERAAMAANSVPLRYLDGWATLNHQKPAQVSDAAWRIALDDGGRFLDQWGSKAVDLDWRPGELFAVKAGLIWRLSGELVKVMCCDRALLASGLVILRQETRGFRS